MPLAGMAVATMMNTMKVLYLFPDTNVFFQCKPLDQVDWSSFGSWNVIQVVLTRPVQAEIDAFKGKGNGRQAARARTTSSLIRQLLDAEDGCMVLRTSPQVVLCLRHGLRRDESMADALDYGERDDQLVGTALGFMKSNSTEEVRLLTNDTGPMASAKAVGLPYHVVPQDWLLPPEAEEAEKREKALRAELAKYKNAEPSFRVETEAPYDKRLQTTVKVYKQLSEEEVDELLERLCRRFPVATDWGPLEAQERPINTEFTTGLSAMFGPTKEVYEPVAPDQIEKYREAYEEWKQACAATLTKLSKALNSNLAWPKLTASIRNVGSRPADDTLVVMEVEGKFVLVPAKHEDDDDDDDSSNKESLTLSRPPSAPKGVWKRQERYGPAIGALAQLQGLTRQWPEHDFPIPRLFEPPTPRDPNGVFFKEGRPGRPSQRVELTCEQWRHAQAAEAFEMAVLCPTKPETYSGLLTLAIHAANLTDPTTLHLPVRIAVEEESCREVAEQMLQRLGA